MHCNDNKIKELIPSYLDRKLKRSDSDIVDAHLASCGDCRAEVLLIRTLSEEDVPDPGEAFWAQMPATIYGEVRQSRRKTLFSLPHFLNSLFIPRWTWATAGIAIIATISWLLMRPGSVDISRTTPHENITPVEIAVSEEPVNVADLSPGELDAVTQWARNEFAPIGEAVGENGLQSGERDLSEDLYELSPRELEQVYEMLKKKEQELRNKLKKPRHEKSVG